MQNKGKCNLSFVLLLRLTQKDKPLDHINLPFGFIHQLQNCTVLQFCNRWKYPWFASQIDDFQWSLSLKWYFLMCWTIIARLEVNFSNHRRWFSFWSTIRRLHTRCPPFATLRLGSCLSFGNETWREWSLDKDTILYTLSFHSATRGPSYIGQ